MDAQEIILLFAIFMYSWVAIKRPIIIAKFLTIQFHYRDPDQVDADRPMRLIWEDEARWRLLYPQQYKLFRATGYLAIVFGLIGLLMWLLSLV